MLIWRGPTRTRRHHRPPHLLPPLKKRVIPSSLVLILPRVKKSKKGKSRYKVAVKEEERGEGGVPHHPHYRPTPRRDKERGEHAISDYVRAESGWHALPPPPTAAAARRLSGKSKHAQNRDLKTEQMAKVVAESGQGGPDGAGGCLGAKMRRRKKNIRARKQRRRRMHRVADYLTAERVCV